MEYKSSEAEAVVPANVNITVAGNMLGEERGNKNVQQSELRH